MRASAFRLAARFTPQPGLTALFGRSGSGKTTLVDIVAGLIRPERGRIVVDGEVLVDTERGIFVPQASPPHRLRLPGQPPVPASHRAAATCSTAAGSAGAAARRRLGSIVDLLGIGRCSSAGPNRCPAARSSGSRSAARCSPSRGCC